MSISPLCVGLNKTLVIRFLIRTKVYRENTQTCQVFVLSSIPFLSCHVTPTYQPCCLSIPTSSFTSAAPVLSMSSFSRNTALQHKVKSRDVIIGPYSQPRSLSDEEEALKPITLTKQHKGAIRAIRKVCAKSCHINCILFQYFLNRNSIPNGVPFQKGIDMVSVCLPLIFHMPAKVGGSGIVAADGRKPWTLFRNGLYFNTRRSHGSKNVFLSERQLAQHVAS